MRTCDQCFKTKDVKEFFKGGRGGLKLRKECIECSRKFTAKRKFNKRKHSPIEMIQRPCAVFPGYLFAGDVA